MTCPNCPKMPVWTFTNQTQLCKNCFIDYFEKKLFKTIRQENLLPKDRIFKIKKENSLNSIIIEDIIKTKFKIEHSKKPNITTESLSQLSEEVFSNVLKGKFKHVSSSSPLSDLTEKEIELYAQLKNIKGTKQDKNQKLQELFSKFKTKNPDLEHNIINAMKQI